MVPPEDPDIPKTNHLDDYAEAGLWNYQWYDYNKEKYTCHAYHTHAPPLQEVWIITIDAYWKAARAFSCLTLIFGGLILIINTSLLVYRFCCNVSLPSPDSSMYFKHPGGYYIRKQLGGWLYLLACICSAFSLLFLKSNACQDNPMHAIFHVCKVTTGARCTYAAMALYFVAASILFLNEGDIEDCDDVEDANYTEPLIQDVIFECEVSRSSSSSTGGLCRGRDNPMAVSAMTWDPSFTPDISERSGEQLEESIRSSDT